MDFGANHPEKCFLKNHFRNHFIHFGVSPEDHVFVGPCVNQALVFTTEKNNNVLIDHFVQTADINKNYSLFITINFFVVIGVSKAFINE